MYKPPHFEGTPSPLKAAADQLAISHNIQVQATHALSGGKRTRRRYWGGAEELSIPAGLVSAGGSDPEGGYADIVQLAQQASTDGGMDNSNKVEKVGGGARVRRRKTYRKYNGRKRSTLRKSGRSRRSSRHVRSARR